MTPSDLVAGIYARQSHGKQTSVDDQIRAGHEVCERESWAVFRTYRDLVSASPYATVERGDWPQLVADVATGKLGVVVMWEATRGDRTLETWANFLTRCQKRDVLIYSIKAKRSYDVRIPRDWITLAEDGVRAQGFSLELSEDVRRGIDSAAAAGKPHGRRAFGYSRLLRDPEDRKTFEDVPNEQAAVAREIITRVAQRDPLKLIRDDLNARGIASPGGGEWSRRGVKHIATNVRYIGLREHNGERHTAAWPAIVDEATFWRAQNVLAENTPEAAAPGSLKYLVSTIMLCGKCTSPCASDKGREGRLPRYRCGERGCVSIGMWEADAYVTELVLERLSRADARQAFATDDDQVAAAHAEVGRLERQLEDARQAYDNDVIDAESLGRKLKAIKPNLEAARAQVAGAREASAVLDLLGTEEFTVATGRPRWKRLSVAARRSVVKTLFSRLELGEAPYRLTRFATEIERLTLASERITETWRH
jgi:DNA invertase Pin-like site-specific DNA recombinase